MLDHTATFTRGYNTEIMNLLQLPGGCKDRSTEIERPFARRHSSYLKPKKNINDDDKLSRWLMLSVIGGKLWS